MTNGKLCILTCCVAMGWAALATAQTAPSGIDDQERALQALRQAESAPVTNDTGAVPTTTPAKKKKSSHKSPPPMAQPAAPVTPMTPSEPLAPATPVPAAPVVSAPTVPAAPAGNDQSEELRALRNAEAAPVHPDQIGNSTVTIPSATMPATTVAPVPDAAAMAEQQRRDEQAKARMDREAQKEALRHQRELERDAKKVAAAKAREDAAVSEADREKEQEKVAKSMERLKRDMQTAPAATVNYSSGSNYNGPGSGTASSSVLSKEQRLADLLRRYQADEITPYQYHMQRAKIIAEP